MTMADPAASDRADGAADRDVDLDLPAVAVTLQRLVAEGLGPAMGVRGDWRGRSAIERVARLGPDELERRLDAIYRTQKASLVAHAAHLLGGRRDAEDVVNEAFLRVWRADPDLRVPEALAPYVRTVVGNEARDRSRASARERATGEPHDPRDLDARLASLDRPLDDRVCDELTIAVGFSVLSDRQRQCLDLRFCQGLTVKETAQRLQIHEGNVKRICHEACRRLAAMLDAA
jgi:RNA polymerase sigma factor (sigma-70 family)